MTVGVLALQGDFARHVAALARCGVRPVEVRPVLAPDLREAFEHSWERNQAGYRYLAGR